MLARTQSGLVARELEARHPGLHVELHILTTTGDRITDRPLHEFGGKGLFTKELEQALLDESVDFAVHSFKDVPVTMPLVDQSNLVIAAVPAREDPRDVLISARARRIEDLPRGAKVGTTSLRRRCQLLAARPDLVVESARGNIDTRLRKLAAGEFDAILLALAGLKRGGLFDDEKMATLDLAAMLPAPGQGALALQCRRDDARTRELLAALNDPDAALCVELERSIVLALQGDCHSPIAALATLDGPDVVLTAAVGGRDGVPPVLHARQRAPRASAHDAAERVMQSLTAQGVHRLLRDGDRPGPV